MSFTQISTNQPPQFPGMESEGFGAPSPAAVKSARSRAMGDDLTALSSSHSGISTQQSLAEF
jgi:hypothetical protein